MLWEKHSKRKNCISYLWQETRGIPTFRLQTTDSKIARRLQRRADYAEIAQFFNSKTWLFRKTFYSNQKALQTFRRVTRQLVVWDALKEEYVAISYPTVDSNSKPHKMESPHREVS